MQSPPLRSPRSRFRGSGCGRRPSSRRPRSETVAGCLAVTASTMLTGQPPRVPARGCTCAPAGHAPEVSSRAEANLKESLSVAPTDTGRTAHRRRATTRDASTAPLGPTEVPGGSPAPRPNPSSRATAMLATVLRRRCRSRIRPSPDDACPVSSYRDEPVSSTSVHSPPRLADRRAASSTAIWATPSRKVAGPGPRRLYAEILSRKAAGQPGVGPVLDAERGHLLVRGATEPSGRGGAFTAQLFGDGQVPARPSRRPP